MHSYLSMRIWLMVLLANRLWSCRIQFSFQGLEWFLYNRTAAYDNIIAQMEKASQSTSRASSQSIFRRPSQQGVLSIHCACFIGLDIFFRKCLALLPSSWHKRVSTNASLYQNIVGVVPATIAISRSKRYAASWH